MLITIADSYLIFFFRTTSTPIAVATLLFGQFLNEKKRFYSVQRGKAISNQLHAVRQAVNQRAPDMVRENTV